MFVISGKVSELMELVVVGCTASCGQIGQALSWKSSEKLSVKKILQKLFGVAIILKATNFGTYFAKTLPPLIVDSIHLIVLFDLIRVLSKAPSMSINAHRECRIEHENIK